MEPDQIRVTAALSAVAGGMFWGMFHLATAVWSGQPVGRREIVVAGLNVFAAIVCGVLAAYYLTPALAPLIPLEALRDPSAIGFVFGFGAWEVTPFCLAFLRRRADKISKGGGE